MQQNKTRKMFLIIIIFSVLALVVSGSMIFAYLSQYVYRDYETKTTATNVTFKYNGKTALDKLSSDDLDLVKGEPTDVTMTVSVVGSASLVVNYNVSFSWGKDENDADLAPPDLAKAVEVYYYDGSRYVFLSMLDQLPEYIKNNPKAISGAMVLKYDEDDKPLYDEDIKLRLVYSAAAGAEYDALLEGNNGFTLKASATAEISVGSSKFVFVTTSREFADEFEDKANVGKTIVLLKTNGGSGNNGNYSISKSLTSKGAVGINLNGCTLDLAGYNLTVDCNGYAGDAEGYAPHYGRLGIIDTRGEGGLVTSVDGGYIGLNNLKSAYLIDNDIFNNTNFPSWSGGNPGSGIIRLLDVNYYVSEDVSDEVKEAKKANLEAVFYDFIDLVKTRTAKLSDGTIYHTQSEEGTHADGTSDVSFLFDNAYAYYKLYAGWLLPTGDDETLVISETPDGTFTINVADENSVTAKYSYAFSFTNRPVNSVTKTVSGYVTVRGNSHYSVAQSLAADIPVVIDRSMLFKTHDAYSGSYIEWLIDDGLGGTLLSSSGRYRRDGIDAMLANLGDTSDYGDKEVDIYIKVTKGAESETFTAAALNSARLTEQAGHAVQVTHRAELLSAPERTARLYDNVPVTVAADDTVGYDILKDYILKDDDGIAVDTGRMQLRGIRVKIIKDDDGEDEENPTDYLDVGKHKTGEVDEDEKEKVNPYFDTAIIKLDDKGNNVYVPQNSLTHFEVEISFFYSEVDPAKSGSYSESDFYNSTTGKNNDAGFEQMEQDPDFKMYTVKTTVSVTGEYSAVTRYDMSYRLQSALSSNNYVDGKDNFFYAYGALLPSVSGQPVAVMVDYTVSGAASKYVIVTYEFLETKVEDMVNQVAYFTKIPSTNTYILVDEAYIEAHADDATPPTYYERKARIEILQSKIPTSDQHNVTIIANLYTVGYGNMKTIDEMVDEMPGLSDAEKDALKIELNEQYTDYKDYYINKKMVDEPTLAYPLDTEFYTGAGSHSDQSGNSIFGTPDYGRYVNDELESCEATDEGAIKVYKDPSTKAVSELKYGLSLVIEGIISNSPEYVADYNLYYVLRDVFDRNSDGLITSKEAEDWARAINPTSGVRSSYLVPDTATGAWYIDLSGLTITSLKGIEYFPGVTGYNLSNTTISDISYLSSQKNVVYLDLSNNRITDIAALSYADDLEYLNLSNNTVTSIEPLRYLPSIKTLILDNNRVTDFDALTLGTEFKLISLNGLRNSLNAVFTYDANVLYSLSLITTNNSKNLGPNDELFVYDQPLTITDEMIVAAEVMYDLEEINRVSNVLYLPTYYYYGDTPYSLYWTTPAGQDDLVITTPSKGSSAEYTVISPIFDKTVTINLAVFKAEQGDTNTYNVSRQFKLTLEKSANAEVYFYDTASGTYLDATINIPDAALRDALFSFFNNDTGSTPVSGTGLPSGATEANVISRAELEWFAANASGYLNMSYKGIKDLSGIEYFNTVIITTLDLSGNILDDLTPLRSLNKLKELYIGGKTYDFNQLIDPSLLDDEVADVARSTHILGSLEALYVYECYGLGTDAVINSLYAVYRNSTADIYIESGTVWDPYAKTLSKAVQGLVSVMQFKSFVWNEATGYAANESQSIYGTNDVGQNNTNYQITLYGYTYSFTATAVTFYQRYNTGASYYTYNATTGLISTHSATTTNRFPNDESVYAKTTIRSTESDRANGTSRIQFSEYYIQLVYIELANYVYLFDNYNTALRAGSSQSGAPSNLEASRANNIYDYSNATPSRNFSGSAAATYNPYSGTGVSGAVEAKPLNQVIGAREIRTTVYNRLHTYLTNATYRARLIQYDSGYTVTDIYEQLMSKTAIGAGSGASKLFNNYYYYDKATGIYYFTTDILIGGSSFFLDNTFSVFGDSTAITTGGTAVYGTTNTVSAVSGMGLIPQLNNLSLTYDAEVEDWAELYHVKKLLLQYTTVDMTTIAGDLADVGLNSLPNLRVLWIANYFDFSADEDAFRCLTGLESFRLYTPQPTYYTSSLYIYLGYIDDLSFLLGLIDDNRTKLWDLQLGNLTSGGIYTTNYCSAQNAAYVGQVYEAAIASGLSWDAATNPLSYRISSPSAKYAAGYFHVDIDGGGGLLYCDSNDPSTVSQSWDSAFDVAKDTADDEQFGSIGYTNVTSSMRDMALKVNGTYWMTSKAYEITSSTTLYMPKTTGSTYYGLDYGDVAAGTPESRDYPITWYYAFATASNSNPTLAAVPSNLTGNLTTRVSNLNSTANGYLVLVGIVKSGLTGITTTDYAYAYHFKVGSGDGAYTSVTDRTLRMYLFSYKKFLLTNNYISITGNTTYATMLTQLLSSDGIQSAAHLSGGNVSNVIYDLTGISNVISKLGRITGLQRIALDNQRIEDISPLYALTGLQYIRINGSNETTGTGYVKLTVRNSGYNLSALTSLTELHLNYNMTITPDDLAYIKSQNLTSLQQLSVYGTRCMRNQTSLELLRDICNNTSADALSIAFNSSATVAQYTLTQFNAFLNTGMTYLDGGINSSSNIVAQGSDSYVQTGVTYGYALTASTLVLVRDYRLSNSIAVKVAVSSTAHPQMSGTYREGVLFTRNDVPSEYTINGYALSSFDTELIAYLLTSGALSTTGTNYTLNKNVAINTEQGIGSFSSLGLFGSAYQVTATGGTNKLAYSYDPISRSVTSTPDNNIAFATPTAALMYLSTTYITSPYNYVEGNQHEFKIYLPRYIYYLDIRYEIDWTAAAQYPARLTVGSGVIADKGADGIALTFNADTITHTFTSATNLYVRARLLKSDGSQYQANVSATISVNRTVEAATTIYDDSFYVQVDDSSIVWSNQSANIAASVTYQTNDATQPYVLYDVQLVPVYQTSENRYYLNGTGTQYMYAVLAAEVFESQRVASILFERYFRTNEVYSNSTDTLRSGYVLTLDQIEAQTTLEMGRETLIATTLNTAWSLEGVQIFRNTDTFIAAYANNFMDISPLATLSLKTFYYGNSYRAHNVIINDFSPLLKGSKHTLEYFTYNGAAATQMTDLSFLLGFDNLKEVYIGSGYYYNATYIAALTYFKSSSGQFVLSALYNRSKPVYVYTRPEVANYVGISYDTSKIGENNLDTTKDVVVYAITPRDGFINASETLSSFGTSMTGVNNSTGVVYSNNYLLTVDRTNSTYVSVETTNTGIDFVTFDVTSTINHNGTLYLIDWTSASSRVAINSRNYRLTADVVIGGEVVSAGTYTREQIEEIIVSPEFYAAMTAGQARIVSSVTVNTLGDTSEGVNTYNARMVARIYMLEGESTYYAYERMLTIAIN